MSRSSSVHRNLALAAVAASLATASFALYAATGAAGKDAPRFGFGKPATPAEIAGWDTDVRPDGKGLLSSDRRGHVTAWDFDPDVDAFDDATVAACAKVSYEYAPGWCLKNAAITTRTPRWRDARKGWMWNVRIAPDGTRAAAVGNDGMLAVYDADTGDAVFRKKVAGKAELHGLDWSPDGGLIAVGAKRYETRGWMPPPHLIGQRLAIFSAKTTDGMTLMERDYPKMDLADKPLITKQIRAGFLFLSGVLFEPPEEFWDIPKDFIASQREIETIARNAGFFIPEYEAKKENWKNAMLNLKGVLDKYEIPFPAIPEVGITGEEIRDVDMEDIIPVF